MKKNLSIALLLLQMACGGDNPLSATSINGVFNLISLNAASADGQTVTVTPPEVTGRMSFEESGRYAWQLNFGGAVSSGSGTYTLSGGIVILDNTTSDRIGDSEANISVSYDGNIVTMRFSLVPPLENVVSMTIRFSK